MTLVREFNLYLTAGRTIPLVINVNQFDSGEQWVFTLYKEDGTQYTPSTGAIVGIKSDGLGIINSGSVVDGKVVINETEQMTAAAGKAVFELLIDSQTHGTANFIVLVEPKPGNNADLSESDLSLLQEAIDATSPLPTGGTVGQVLTKTANGSTWSDAGTPTQEQVASAVSDWADEHITVETGVVIDTSLSVAGAAADAKATGDEISDLKSAVQQMGGGLTADIKQALMNCFNYVAWKDNDPNASQYISALQSALYPPVNLVSISAVYTQSGTVYTTDSLDSLKPDLVVTAHYSDSTTETVSNYLLSGTLTAGTSVITVSYGGKTTTFNVTVSAIPEYGTFTPQNVIDGSYITSTGEISPSTYSSYSEDYMRVFANTYYFNFDNLGSNPNWTISEYDSSKTFIGQYHVTNSGNTYGLTGTSRTLVLDDGTEYVRLSWYGNDQIRLPTVTMNSVSCTDLPMEIGDIDGTTGEEIVQAKRCRSTTYIPITASTITVSNCPFWGKWTGTVGGWVTSGAGYVLRCFDSSYNILGSSSYISDITSTITPPSGTAYVKLVIQKNNNNFPTDFADLVVQPIVIDGVNYRIVEA